MDVMEKKPAPKLVALRQAIAALPTPTPCAGLADEFTSDDVAELEQAARRCAPCPVRRQCRAAGYNAFHGVWGGLVVVSFPTRRYTPEVAA